MRAWRFKGCAKCGPVWSPRASQPLRATHPRKGRRPLRRLPKAGAAPARDSGGQRGLRGVSPNPGQAASALEHEVR